MRGLRILMLILLAVVFTAGGPLRVMPASAAHAAAPCHEMADMPSMDMAQDKAPAHKPRPDIMAMSCCVGCLPAGVRDAAPGRTPGAVRIAFPDLHQAFDGQSPAPDHGPPRPFA